MSTESYQVVYPPSLQLITDVNGNDMIIGYRPSTNKMVRYSMSTILSGKSVPLWEPDEEYDVNFIVEFGLRFWKSKHDENEGNVPSENSHWTEVSGDLSSNVWRDMGPWNPTGGVLPPSTGLLRNHTYDIEYPDPDADPVEIGGKLLVHGATIRYLSGDPEEITSWRIYN